EQAQGKVNEIDRRSDIFSFGCILFEAVTGQKPFVDESVVKSLDKVVHEAAPPIKDYNPLAPPDLQRIVSRCLAKDRKDRYQTIKVVAIELKALLHELEDIAGTSTAAEPSRNDETRNQSSAGSTAGQMGAAATETRSLDASAGSSGYGVTRIRRNVVLALAAL